MNVSDAIDARRSIRAFLDKPVDGDLLRQLLTRAARAPSGGNLQPWHLYVLGGDRMAAFRSEVRTALQRAPEGEPMEYAIYPPELDAPYRDRRWENAQALYAQLGIPREDKQQRRDWFARNFDFFGAPVGLFCFVDRQMGPPQWSDLGMYLQTLMLLLKDAGLDSCPQECWAMYPALVQQFVGAPDNLMLFTGMSIGHADPAAVVNELRTDRAPLEAFAEFQGL
ncbi:MAG: nitroreductase family protein [Salinisphaeraceae bacterium]|jgi:nitroreductase|nr:nitroreductase family protein [Salinisphaeraceae bacterium]